MLIVSDWLEEGGFQFADGAAQFSHHDSTILIRVSYLLEQRIPTSQSLKTLKVNVHSHFLIVRTGRRALPYTAVQVQPLLSRDSLLHVLGIFSITPRKGERVKMVDGWQAFNGSVLEDTCHFYHMPSASTHRTSPNCKEGWELSCSYVPGGKRKWPY